MPTPDRRSFLAAAAGSAAALAARPAVSSSADPVRRTTSGSLFKLSVAAYSFNKYLPRGDKPGEITLEDVVDFAAEQGLPGVELTGYYFPKSVQSADLRSIQMDVVSFGAGAGPGETRWVEPDSAAAIKTRSYLNTLSHRCFTQGLTVSGTAIGNDFALPPGKARDKQIADCRRWIDIAAVLGAPVIRIFAGKVPKGGDEKEAITRCAAGINECLKYAATKGVHLALENHGGITATPAQMLSIIEQVDDSPWFGVNFDSGNFQTDTPYDDLAQIAPYAINAQIKVMIRPNGRKEPANLKRILGILLDAGYRGWLVLEYEEGGADLAETKAETARWLDKLRDAMG
ncbi:MAG: sugar phosphate isomerase/epimerase family protein [Planctomycetota bacterium]